MKVDGKWIDCVIYQTLYDNPDGVFWVRSSKEFYNLFTEVITLKRTPSLDWARELYFKGKQCRLILRLCGYNTKQTNEIIEEWRVTLEKSRND